MSATPAAASSRLQRAGAVLWPSFFAAAVATMVCFAFVDPEAIVDATWAYAHIDRRAAYTLGFFAFWACTLGASAFTALLLRTPSRGAR